MNDSPLENEVSTSPAPDQVAPVATTPVVPAFDPRRRIRELLSIPERDRTDAEWDELNELEIQTAPGNRTSNQPPLAYSGKPSGGGGMPSKNRFKGKSRKPGQGGGGNRPPQPGGNKPNNKPRPA